MPNIAVDSGSIIALRDIDWESNIHLFSNYYVIDLFLHDLKRYVSATDSLWNSCSIVLELFGISCMLTAPSSSMIVICLDKTKYLEA